MSNSFGRRSLLKASLIGLGASALGNFWSSVAQAATAPSKRLVFIFLRGGADALSLVAPVASESGVLASARHTTLLASPVALSSHLNLHHQFGPLLGDADVKASFNAVIHAGSINETRSHFEQQAFIECGDSAQVTTQGFLGVAASVQSLPAAAMGWVPPASLQGGDPVVLQDPAALRPGYALGYTKPSALLTRAMRMKLFHGSSVPMNQLADSTTTKMDAASAALGDVTLAQLLAHNGYLSSSFGQRLAVGAALMGSDYDPRIITVDAEQGWDTHGGQQTNGTSDGDFGAKVKDLATNLLAFKRDLLARGNWANTAVVVMSEFGRTLRENGGGGTDHGRGGVMLLMGGAIRPHSDPLYRGRRQFSLPTTVDSSSALDVVHDYRVVLHELLMTHLGLSAATATALFKPDGVVSAADHLGVAKS